MKKMAKRPPKTPEFQRTSETLTAVGSFGRYQIYVCFVIQYSAIIGSGIFALGTFGQIYQTQNCTDPNFAGENENTTHQCAVIQNCSANGTVAIQRYVFFSQSQEWNLVCHRKTLFQITFGLSAVGRMLGAIIGGHLGDYFGRKAALYPSQFAICLITSLSTACTRWESFAACFCLVGIVYGIAETSSFTLVMEYTSTKHRWIMNGCFQWILQYPIVALIAYLTADWRLYLIVINVILAPLLVFYLVFLESPRYLIYQQNLDRAAKVLRSSDTRFPSPLCLFRNCDYTRLTLTLMLALLARSCVSSRFIQHVDPEAGNPFVNIALYGLGRIYVPFLIIFVDWKFVNLGRRHIFLASLISVIACASIVMVLEITHRFHGVLEKVVDVIAASLSASGLWMSSMQILCEAYPTAVRGIAYGWVSMMDGLGGLIMLYVLDLHNVWTPLPTLINIALLVASLVTGYFFMPETKFGDLKDGLNELKIHEKPVQNRPDIVECTRC